MTKQQFIESIEKSYQEAMEIVKRKNADYAVESNPFKNFEYASYCNVSVEKAILVRISDKFARLCNLIDKGEENREVLDETTADTILDICNYLVILKTYMEAKDVR
jgi:hypothetical protein